ncbi:hypothetical protein OG976_07785 [Mycobacterium sp. NBC_00419]
MPSTTPRRCSEDRGDTGDDVEHQDGEDRADHRGVLGDGPERRTQDD